MTRVEAAFDLDAYLRDRGRRVERALAGVLDRALRGAPSEVAEVARYACEGPAKRIRPILALAVHEALGGERAVERLAVSVEVIHGYSLVHDDLPAMDDDDLRRGRPTAHRVFGPARAARGAAAMIPLAFQIAAEEAAALGLPADARRAIALDLAEGAGPRGMVGGQWLDLERPEPAPDEAREIDLRKTAALLVVAARIGAHSALAGPEAVESVAAYARDVGLAFQSRDDWLDAGRPTEGRAAAAREEARRRGASAVERVRAARITAPALEALAGFAAERDR